MSYKLIYCVILLCGIIVIRLHTLNYKYTRYNDYLQKFNKSYNYDEFRRRLVYFEESLEEIERLNKGHYKTGAVHGLTKFSDWSREELNNMFLMKSNNVCQSRYARSTQNKKNNVIWFDEFSIVFGGDIQMISSSLDYPLKVPEKLDWRNMDGVIGPVDNQKLCNGCWAFGIVGIMEAMAAIDGKGHEQLSVQQLLDCCDVSKGCNGGNIDQALEAMYTNNQTLTTEDQYPIKLVSETCRRLPYNGVRGIKSYEKVCDVSDDFILQKLVHGPLMAVIHPTGWVNYNSGVIARNCNVPTSGMLHVVQIVGYDTTTDEEGEVLPYYIIKNSWGSDWGEDGYIRIARGHNLCGINNHIVSLDVE